MPEILVWWLGAIALTYVVARVAGWYMDRFPVTPDDTHCAEVDDEINRGPWMVGSRLDVVDHLTQFDPEAEFTELDLAWLAEHSIGGVQ